ncbi:MAG TPA: DGQHR domain-containing protein [Thermoanaerobaculia bacterium]|nr:DGQHR domain-containing protein [Thermoanaerobaculia bacterium]
MKDLVLTSLRFQQSGRTFYSTFMTGELLLSPGVAQVDKWTPSNPKGYQRDPSTRRFNKVASFLRGDQGVPGILPQSVLLGLRGTAQFTKVDLNGSLENGLNSLPWEFGMLRIPADMLPLIEDDGQHRIGGLRKAAESDPRFLRYPLPTVIMEGSDPLQEAVLFYVINTTSVKVPVDLAQRLIAQQDEDPNLHRLLVETGRDWVARATNIVDILNEAPDQPWEQSIIIPNGDVEVGVKQNTIVRSLRPLLTGDHVYKNQDPGILAELLIRYWKTIGDLWPDAINRESRDEYSLMKSVGVLTMHNIAPMVFEAARVGGKKVTQEAIREVLEPVAKKYNIDFWDSKSGEAGKVGTNNKAVRYLSDLIVKQVRPGVLSSSLL